MIFCVDHSEIQASPILKLHLPACPFHPLAFLRPLPGIGRPPSCLPALAPRKRGLGRAVQEQAQEARTGLRLCLKVSATRTQGMKPSGSSGRTATGSLPGGSQGAGRHQLITAREVQVLNNIHAPDISCAPTLCQTANRGWALGGGHKPSLRIPSVPNPCAGCTGQL